MGYISLGSLLKWWGFPSLLKSKSLQIDQSSTSHELWTVFNDMLCCAVARLKSERREENIMTIIVIENNMHTCGDENLKICRPPRVAGSSVQFFFRRESTGENDEPTHSPVTCVTSGWLTETQMHMESHIFVFRDVSQVTWNMTCYFQIDLARSFLQKIHGSGIGWVNRSKLPCVKAVSGH